MPRSVFTRAQLYEVLRLSADGYCAREIRDHLGLNCALETIRRATRGDTLKTIGVGATERAQASNMLQGENRRTGDFVLPRPVLEAKPWVAPNYSPEAAAEIDKLGLESAARVAAELTELAAHPPVDPLKAYMEARPPAGKRAVLYDEDEPPQ